jgi:hypothetical protein
MGARPLEVADAFEANELFGRNGWTDGLPIVPPTRELVHQCLDAAFLETDSILGVEPVRGYPFAVIPHPIAPDSDEALRQKAAEAIHQCQELLLQR